MHPSADELIVIGIVVLLLVGPPERVVRALGERWGRIAAQAPPGVAEQAMAFACLGGFMASSWLCLVMLWTA